MNKEDIKNIAIRAYEDKDKDAVKKLYSDLEYLEPTFSKLDDSHYKKFLYDKDGVMGIIILDVSYLVLNIFNIHISKSARGNGIGHELIEFTLKYCKENKLHGVRVNTDSENKSAHDFYLGNGFERVGEVENYDTEGNKAVFFYRSVGK